MHQLLDLRADVLDVLLARHQLVEVGRRHVIVPVEADRLVVQPLENGGR